jgi:cytochrome oxidase Cu insertion factor (SCO1/SenC/PrrC family)
VIPMKDGVKHSAPDSFAAQTLDGEPINLASFKGKYVLLAFWSLRSDGSTQKLAELQKLPVEFRYHRRLAIVGASVDADADADAVGKAAEARGYSWTQTWLNAGNLAKAAATFDVSKLPAIYLLDPDGRIIARDLEGNRLLAALGLELLR